MGQLELADIFPAVYLGYVAHYRERIQAIVNEYDVVIFMARKAICFFKALQRNGEIRVPSTCTVLSSRILDYDILDTLKGRKIALVDDVVVKGDSLRAATRRITTEGMKARILVSAVTESFEIDAGRGSPLTTCFERNAVLQEDELLAFAGMITEYIEASMCPFNIDQPIFNLDTTERDIQQLLYDTEALDITSDNQRKHGLSSHVMYFTGTPVLPDSPLAILNDSIIKLRILSSGARAIAVPFVLLPEITGAQIDDLFAFIANNVTTALINVGNCRLREENEVKLFSYFLSEAVAQILFRRYGITAHKQTDNDLYQFGSVTESLYRGEIDDMISRSTQIFGNFEPIYIEYSKFTFTNVIASCYRAIAAIPPGSQRYYNVRGERIADRVITHELFTEAIRASTPDPSFLSSCVIDILIDRGWIVPALVHTDTDAVLRAYKLGEYSKLTRDQLLSFSHMLYVYHESIGSGLDKTELEKLCVLFFRSALDNGRFSQQEKYEDGCYSACYSLYGPRMSASEESYVVNSDSALITDLCQDDRNGRLVVPLHGKYFIRPCTSLNPDFPQGFAYGYQAVRQVFKDAAAEAEAKGITTTPWNPYVRTYDQYLTLRAIGNNKKNQYLSLCAELYQAIHLSTRFFDRAYLRRRRTAEILSGINSGLWKYWCYSDGALDATTRQIAKRDRTAGIFLLTNSEKRGDIQPEWQTVIDEVGSLLYRIAFFIKEVLVASEVDARPIVDDEVARAEAWSVKQSMRQPFSAGPYSNRNPLIASSRREIEEMVAARVQRPGFDKWCETEFEKLKQTARLQLDTCDVILEGNSPSVTYSTKFLLLYSSDCVFPAMCSEPEMMRHELHLRGVRQRSAVRLYALPKGWEETIASIFEMGFVDISGSLKSLVIDMTRDAGLTAISPIDSTVAKGSTLARRINDAIGEFEQYSSEVVQSAGRPQEVLVASDQQLPSTIEQRGVRLISPYGEEQQLEFDSLLSRLIQALQPTGPTGSCVKYEVGKVDIHTGPITLMAQTVNLAERQQVYTSDDTYNTDSHNTTTVVPDFFSHLEEFEQELTQMMAVAIQENATALKAALQEALAAVHAKDESKFRKALSTIGSFATLAGTALAYAQAFGFAPH